MAWTMEDIAQATDALAPEQLPAMESCQLPHIDIDGYSLPYRWEGAQLFVLGFWDDANKCVIPTPRPELYIVRVPCTAHFVIKADQMPLGEVFSVEAAQIDPAPASAGDAVVDDAAASETNTSSQG